MALFGLVRRREVWVPSWRGWMLLLAGTALAAGFLLFGIVPFLALDRPLHRGILVVEGWLPDYALKEAKQVFESHAYRLLVVTGVPIEQGFFITQERDYAQLSAKALQGLGISSNSIVRLSCENVPRDRTYATAVKVRDWLRSQGIHEPVDVLTLGVHARRTWMLYQAALERPANLGIISTRDLRYDAHAWWRTSSGFRTVTGEAIAYLYAKFFFVPRRFSGKAQLSSETLPDLSHK